MELPKGLLKYYVIIILGERGVGREVLVREDGEGGSG